MTFRKIIFCIFIFLWLGTDYSMSQELMILTLEQSIELALQYNRTLSALREKLKETQAKLGEARTAFFPKLTGSANYTKLDVAPFMPGKVFESISENLPSIPGIPAVEYPKRIPIGQDEIVGIGLQLQQPIFTGFSIINGFRIAREGVKASKAEYIKEKNDLIYSVEEAYWGVVKADKFVEVAREAVKQVEGHVNDLENMYYAGMVTKNDLLKARVQLSNTKLMGIQAENGLQMTKKAFCNILGIPLESEIELKEDLSYESVPQFLVDEVHVQALNKRPEIEMMQSGLTIGEKAVDIAAAGYLPSLTLLLDYGYRKPDREYNRQFYTTWTVSVVASMNIFDWGATHYKKTQAQKRLSQMQENLENVKSAIRLEVTQSVLRLKEAEERIKVAQENITQAQENFKVTEDLFQQGMVTNTDYLDANTLLVQSKTDYISALADYKLAEAQLERAAGVIGRRAK